MRVPRVRFTVRTMMIGMKVFAFLLFVPIEIGRLRQVAQLRRAEALKYAEMETILQQDLERIEKDLTQTHRELEAATGKYANMKIFAGERLPYLEQDVSRCNAPIQYAEILKRKYTAAASHPWASIGPDPPTPEQNMNDHRNFAPGPWPGRKSQRVIW